VVLGQKIQASHIQSPADGLLKIANSEEITSDGPKVCPARKKQVTG
jgi:hypothetical protein